MKVEFSTKQMAQALDEYATATKRDMAYVCDRAGMNVCLRAAQGTPKANASEIRALKDEPWWPAFVGKQFKGEKFTKREAKEMSRKIIGARVRAIKFTMAGWFPGARILAARIGRSLRISGKKSYGTAIPAKSLTFNPVTVIINRAKGAPVVGKPALVAAFAYVASDMMTFARKRMAATARRHSAK